jgi:hypothetical protein
VRRARPRRDHDSLRSQSLNLAYRHLIIAANLDFGAQLADVLHQVVGKRIVIIEYENQAAALLISDYTGAAISDRRPQTPIQTTDRYSEICNLHSEITLPT